MTFDELGLSDTLLQAVAQSGYTSPTPIQEKAIPAILEGRDVMAAAQTGTGKTAGFTLPLLEKLAGRDLPEENSAYVLVLTPTRELAAQVQESIRTYGKHEDISSTVVFGGVNINAQKKALRKGVDILVATPGRLLDLYQQKSVNFSDIDVLVLDEADRMLDMGFIHDIRRIIKLLPEKRQNLMFSATFSSEIRTLAKTICRNPVEIDVAPRNSTVDAITQGMYQVDKGQKISMLTSLLKDTTDQVLVFSRTKHGADKIAKRLNKEGVNAAAIHGNKSQNQRTKALADFKNNRVQVLVATDIAARGIDIDMLPQVINFDLPQVAEDYVHRIGRTGRAGASGLAISLVSPDESKQLKAIERLIARSINRLTHEYTLQTAPAGESGQSNTRRADSRRPQGQARKSSRPSQGQGRKSAGSSQGQGRSNTNRSAKMTSNDRNTDFWKSFPSSMAAAAKPASEM